MLACGARVLRGVKIRQHLEHVGKDAVVRHRHEDHGDGAVAGTANGTLATGRPTGIIVATPVHRTCRAIRSMHRTVRCGGVVIRVLLVR